jgi:hypothetical protein
LSQDPPGNLYQWEKNIFRVVRPGPQLNGVIGWYSITLREQRMCRANVALAESIGTTLSGGASTTKFLLRIAILSR